MCLILTKRLACNHHLRESYQSCNTYCNRGANLSYESVSTSPAECTYCRRCKPTYRDDAGTWFKFGMDEFDLIQTFLFASPGELEQQADNRRMIELAIRESTRRYDAQEVITVPAYWRRDGDV